MVPMRLLISIALPALLLAGTGAEACDIEWVDQFGNSISTSLVVGRLETLSDRGRLGPGEFNSLVQRLEAVLAALQRRDSALARQGLEVFIADVQGLRRRRTLSDAEASSLVTGATDVHAQL
jgi:hypothetical protein